jgi:aspartyl-tRNA(Asn)/glutamyl-tRNA(Gln) amidotransferase subunit A
MNFSNDCGLTISNLAPKIRRRLLSPVELTSWILARIEKRNPDLNAYITITSDLALEQAKRTEREIARGRYRGPLHGIPICLKDLFFTEGIRTTAGSRILRDFVPPHNAAVVDRLMDAGAILLGKTNLHEFAYGATNVNPHFGPVHNPWNHGRMSGGSSGGSAAAVTAGLAVASLGTDTGGSIRIPAAACGCVGLKPTYGRVPLCGVIPLAQSLDHVGPICRCVTDAVLMLEAIAGADPCDPASFGKTGARFGRGLKTGLRGLRIGVPRQYFFDRLQPDVKRNTLKAIAVMERHGGEIVEVNVKRLDETSGLAGIITLAESLVYHHPWILKRPDDYGLDLRTRFKEGMEITALAYLQSQEARCAYTQEFENALQSVDIVVGPTLPVAAPRMEEGEVLAGRSKENVRMALLRLTRPGNLTGLPAISLPSGFTREGMPTGLQMIGRRMDERTVLRAAFALEQATPWHKVFPPDSEPG